MFSFLKRYRCVLEANKVYLFILTSCYFVGIILGIVFFSELERVLFADNAVDFLIAALSKKGSPAGLLLTRFLNSLAMIVVFGILGFLVYLCPLTAILIIYRGYVLGAALVAFLSGFGLTGVVLFLFSVLLQNLITTACLIIFSVIAFDISKKSQKCGKFNYKNYFCTLIIAFLVCCLGALLEFLLLALVLRPLNFYF